MNKSSYFFGILLCCLLLEVVQAKGQDQASRTSLSEREYLTGSWEGQRDLLAGKGIRINSTLIGDLFANLGGGIELETAFLDNWELALSMDMEPLLGWKGGYINGSLLQNNGQLLTTSVGDLQTTNNIEAVQTIRIYELWIEQVLFKNKLSILSGVYDINSEFDYIDSATLFINSSQGMGAALAASGLVGPPTFPATGLAARVKIKPTPQLYVQAAATDAVPGVYHVDWQLNNEKGFFYIAEIGLLHWDQDRRASGQERIHVHINRHQSASYDFKIALGGWRYSRNYVFRRYGSSLSSGENERGAYLFLDMASLSWLDDRLRQMSWHLRLGVADNDLSRLQFYGGSGVTYSGLIPGRPNDVTGVAIAAAKNSWRFEQVTSSPQPSFEIAYEWTYRATIAPWLNVQPNIQYIQNPGMHTSVDAAFIVGLRTSFAL